MHIKSSTGSTGAVGRPIENGIHQHWWTTLLALPTDTASPAFAALQRIWGDNTINTIERLTDGSLSSKRKRGIYLQSEDQMMMALFENWAAFPDCSWVESLLSACHIKVAGQVAAVGWSYEYTQDRPGKTPGKATADIVVHWRDASGSGILVFEAKKPGCRKLDEKDLPSRGPYADVPGYADIDPARRHVCLLLAAADIMVLANHIASEPVLTWERLLGLQCEATLRLALPDSVHGFMVGAIVHQAAQYGLTPAPLPFEWMANQPKAPDIKEAVGQTRADRRMPFWQPFRQFSAKDGGGHE